MAYHSNVIQIDVDCNILGGIKHCWRFNEVYGRAEKRNEKTSKIFKETELLKWLIV